MIIIHLVPIGGLNFDDYRRRLSFDANKFHTVDVACLVRCESVNNLQIQDMLADQAKLHVSFKVSLRPFTKNIRMSPREGQSAESRRSIVI